jgi:hypothetical protein
MKKSILISLIFSLSLFGAIPAPKWFVQDKVNIYVYSYGNSIKEAKLKAKKKLEVKLNISSIDINDFEIVKDELFELKYFIKSKYVAEDIYTQIQKKLKTFAFKIEDQDNVFLKNTEFFKKLNKEFGYYPNIELVDNNIYFDNTKFIIKKHELKDFISVFNDDNISIGIKDEIETKEKFFIKITSNYNGFITLAQINNGSLKLLLKNKKIKKSIIFPNFKISDGYTLSLNSNQMQSNITTIVSICDEKKDLSNYNMYFDDNIDKVFEFRDFINEMKNCKISTKTTRIIE